MRQMAYSSQEGSDEKEEEEEEEREWTETTLLIEVMSGPHEGTTKEVVAKNVCDCSPFSFFHGLSLYTACRRTASGA